jgi:hypothetical protein
MIDLLYHLDAHKTEGIFRIAAFPEEVKTLKEQLDLGNYQPLKFVTQVHSVAAILKM